MSKPRLFITDAIIKEAQQDFTASSHNLSPALILLSDFLTSQANKSHMTDNNWLQQLLDSKMPPFLLSYFIRAAEEWRFLYAINRGSNPEKSMKLRAKLLAELQMAKEGEKNFKLGPATLGKDLEPTL